MPKRKAARNSESVGRRIARELGELAEAIEKGVALKGVLQCGGPNWPQHPENIRRVRCARRVCRWARAKRYSRSSWVCPVAYGPGMGAGVEEAESIGEAIVG